MTRTFMHAQLHGARVTACDLDSVGSITIDSALMDAVGLAAHQRVQICNKANGERFETYVIVAPAGSRQICVNGAAARLVNRGDELLIIGYCDLTDEEAKTHQPKVAFLSPDNEIVELNA